MSQIERYRLWYQHERDANRKMLDMIRSVPKEAQSDPRFARALVLAAHLAACRENFLGFLEDRGEAPGPWWPERADLAHVEAQYAKIEERWTTYLDRITDEGLDGSFEFEDNGWRFKGNVEDQIAQLAFHSFYHRGQIAQLVDQVGGETVDTDFVDWIAERRPDRWGSA